MRSEERKGGGAEVAGLGAPLEERQLEKYSGPREKGQRRQVGNPGEIPCKESG